MSRREQSYARKRKKAFRKEFEIPSFTERVKASLKAKTYKDGEGSR
jgi:hypothetical protein